MEWYVRVLLATSLASATFDLLTKWEVVPPRNASNRLTNLPTPSTIFGCYIGFLRILFLENCDDPNVGGYHLQPPLHSTFPRTGDR